MLYLVFTVNILYSVLWYVTADKYRVAHICKMAASRVRKVRQENDANHKCPVVTSLCLIFLCITYTLNCYCLLPHSYYFRTGSWKKLVQNDNFRISLSVSENIFWLYKKMSYAIPFFKHLNKSMCKGYEFKNDRVMIL